MYENYWRYSCFAKKNGGRRLLLKRKRGTTAVWFLFSCVCKYHFFSVSSMLFCGSFFASVTILYTYSVIHCCE